LEIDEAPIVTEKEMIQVNSGAAQIGAAPEVG
jgi:hypothetical protein